MGPAPHPPKGHSPHICCGQMAGWIKMPLGVKVGLGPGDFVLDGDPAPPKEGSPIFGPCILWPNSHQGATWYGGMPRPKRHCVSWGPSSPPKRDTASPQFSAHFYCGQTAVCIRIPLGTEVGLSLGDIVLRGPSSPSPKGAHPLSFRPMSIVAKRLDG